MTTAREKLSARRKARSVRTLATLLIVFILLTGATWAASWLATPGTAEAHIKTPTNAPEVTDTDAPKPTETDKPAPTATDPPAPTETVIPLITETNAPAPTVTAVLPTYTATTARKYSDPTATPFRGWPTKTPNARFTPTPTMGVCDICLEVRGIRLALERLVDIFEK